MKSLSVAACLILLGGIAAPLLAVPVTSPLPRASHKADVTAMHLVRLMRSQLSAGWKATYDPQEQWLQVMRLQKVPMTETLPNEAPVLPGHKPAKPRRYFLFGWHVVPYVSPNEHRRLKASNDAISQKMSALYGTLESNHVPHKFDSFLPRTPEEKKQVAEYERLKASLHSLPDFFFHDISLVWGWKPFDSPTGYVSIDDEPVRHECEAVVHKVTALLSHYSS